ncbi:hypothetical protein [Lactiplantibacillus modestisalitolerans]|uniref:Cell surface protein n=1 Tax=Lactiplantibacillus modestisalitolerans TaxID=1457219 RepID=A0ABV5WU62_9LACO|nr:hypothetical protein [Lactiplantibacillus modestisalitolerans]
MKKIVWSLRIGIIVFGTTLVYEQVQIQKQATRRSTPVAAQMQPAKMQRVTHPPALHPNVALPMTPQLKPVSTPA